MKEWRDGGMLKRVSVESFNYGLCGAQKCRGNPCDCPDVDEAICSALLVVNCRYGQRRGHRDA